jgi:hypothetical protein
VNTGTSAVSVTAAPGVMPRRLQRYGPGGGGESTTNIASLR